MNPGNIGFDSAGRRHAMIMLATLGLLAFSACTGPGVEHLDDGSYVIDCSGGAPSWSRCFSRAQLACDGPDFEILSQVSNEGSASVGTNDWSNDGSEVSRTLVIACGRTGGEIGENQTD